PPASVLVRTAARAGREDDRQDVEPLAGVGVQQVPDGSTVGVGLRRAGGGLLGAGEEAVHRRSPRRGWLLLRELPGPHAFHRARAPLHPAPQPPCRRPTPRLPPPRPPQPPA